MSIQQPLAKRPSPFNGPTAVRRGKAPTGQAYTPPDVIYTQCPNYVDNRFTPILPAEGGEFIQAWRVLRGEPA